MPDAAPPPSLSPTDRPQVASPPRFCDSPPMTRAAIVLILLGACGNEDPCADVSGACIGLTAGASTPEELVALVLRSLAALGYDDYEEVEVARESVHFRLPREVAAT